MANKIKFQVFDKRKNKIIKEDEYFKGITSEGEAIVDINGSLAILGKESTDERYTFTQFKQ